ncbi:MAG: CYTH domain-containing protein [Gammaproteobacteria bacterium]
MGIEIERKFLVSGSDFLAGRQGRKLVQGYITNDGHASVRVRIDDTRAFLTIKAGRDALARLEYEYPIPLPDAQELLARVCTGPQIDKTRYDVEIDGSHWEVDVFHGDNDGLVIAEIELPAADAPFARPAWLGDEVTGDARYLNVNLAQTPWRRW